MLTRRTGMALSNFRNITIKAGGNAYIVEMPGVKSGAFSDETSLKEALCAYIDDPSKVPWIAAGGMASVINLTPKSPASVPSPTASPAPAVPKPAP